MTSHFTSKHKRCLWAGSGDKKPTRKSLGTSHTPSRAAQPICHLSCLCMYLLLSCFPPSLRLSFLSQHTCFLTVIIGTQLPPPGVSVLLVLLPLLTVSSLCPGAFPRVGGRRNTQLSSGGTGSPWIRCRPWFSQPRGRNLGNGLISLQMDVREINNAGERV